MKHFLSEQCYFYQKFKKNVDTSIPTTVCLLTLMTHANNCQLIAYYLYSNSTHHIQSI